MVTSGGVGRSNRYFSGILSLCLLTLCLGVSAAEPCNQAKSVRVNYSNSDKLDTLKVTVVGNPCSEARVNISVARADGVKVYEYQGAFIEHMPFLIHEPELNHLVTFFLDKVLKVAMQQSTADLPSYSGVESFYEATNNFVVVPLDEYEALRTAARPQPLLWHATGDSSWMHAVYDPETEGSRVIMRGGVFQ